MKRDMEHEAGSGKGGVLQGAEAREEWQLAELADFFGIFGDTTRTRILYELAGGSLCVGELARRLRMTDSAVSHQLKVLRDNALVKAERRGKKVAYALSDEHVSIILATGLTHLGEKWEAQPGDEAAEVQA